MQPIPLVTPGYQSRSLNADAQRMINWYPESSDGGKTVVALYPTPGLLVDATLGTGPIRGMFSFAGAKITVSGANVYSNSTLIGTLTTSTGPVVAAKNTVTLVIADGTLAYGWDGTTWASLPDIGAATHIAFIDQYLIFNVPSTGQFKHTNLVSTTVDTLDVATAEGAPDNLVALIADHRQLWLFGTESIEVFHNFADPDQVFQRIEGSFMEHGCVAKYSAAKADNAVLWLSTNERGQGQLMLARGYQPQIVSTRSIEYQWAQYSTISDAIAWTYLEDGHVFYQLTFPTALATWVYDLSTNLWHERESYLLGRHLSNCHVFHGGVHYVGDYRNGKVYKQSTQYDDDNGEDVIRTRTFQYISANRGRVFHDAIEVEFETGTALSTDTEPQAMLSWSDNNGRTFSSEYWRSLGVQGEYDKRARWDMLGQTINRIYKLVVSGKVKTAVVGAYGAFDAGED